MSTAAEATLAEAALRNRRRRGVVGGLVLVALGVSFILPPLGVTNAISYLFLTLGGAFVVAYLNGMRPMAYLVPSATLIGLGVGLLVPTWFGLPGGVLAASFLVSLAVAFAAVFLLRPARRWPLAPAAIFAAVGVAEMYGQGDVIPSVLQPFLVPLVLLVVGLYVVFVPRAD